MLNLSKQEVDSFLPSLLDPSTIFNQSLSQNTTRVILVRHGRSTYNEAGRYQGCSDESVLTEKGHKTAYQTGVALKSVKIDVIYTSPLKRVRETAQEIINARSSFNASIPPILVTDKLKEIDLSAWQGLSYQYVKEDYAQEYFCWKNSPHQFKLPDQATFPVLDLYQKAREFWQEILPQHQGKTILIVSHGGTNRALINTAIGISPDSYHFIQQCNCGISILEFNQLESKRGQLKALNLTAHLGKTLPKLKEGKQGLRLLLLSADSSRHQLQQLAKFWQQESIDFVFSNNWESSFVFTQSLCPKRSQFLYLQVPKNNVLKVWQQQIFFEKIVKSLATEQSLVTGLIVLDRVNLNQVLTKISSSYAEVFADNSLNIIHYPHLDKHPIFQEIAITTSELGQKTEKVCLKN